MAKAPSGPAGAAPTVSWGGSLLRMPAFRWLWCAHLVSAFGDGLYSVALPWLVWQHTGSGVATALTLATSSFSFLLVGPIAGVYVDRWPRRPTMILADLSRAVSLVVLPLVLLSHYSLGVALLLAAGLPAMSRFFVPAQRAMVPSLVPEERLLTANAYMQGAGNSAFIAGPAAAGLLILISGPIALLFVDAATFVVSAGFLSLARFPSSAPRSAPRSSIRHELAEGFRVSWRTPPLRAVCLFAVFAAACIAPSSSLLPVWIGRSGGDSSEIYGLLTSCVFAGSLAGSVVAGHLGKRVPRGMLMVASLAGMGVAIASYGNARQLLPCAVALTVLGVSITTYNVSVMTLLQELSPREVLGRVFAVTDTFTWSLQPFGMIGAAAIADRAGVHLTLVGLGCGMLALSTVAAASRAIHAKDAPAPA